MSDHHVRWSSFQWWTSPCWSYLLYDSRSTFRSQCCEAISAYARLIKFNLSILRVQNWLAPVVCERRVYHTRSSRGVSTRRTIATVHTRGKHLYLQILVKESSYNATAVLRKIRCIKDKHHMQSKYVTWSLSSSAWHLDLHRSIVVISPTIASKTITNA